MMGGWDYKLNKEEAMKFVIIIDQHEDGLSLSNVRVFQGV